MSGEAGGGYHYPDSEDEMDYDDGPPWLTCPVCGQSFAIPPTGNMQHAMDVIEAHAHAHPGHVAIPMIACSDPGPCVNGPDGHQWRQSCQPDRDSGW